jgi:D-lactate dehydrogenase
VAARATRALLSDELVPDFPKQMPRPATALPATEREGAAAVYLPACVNRIFGRPRGAGEGVELPRAVVDVSARAGLPVWIPEDAPGHCCAVPWSSKGLDQGHELMANRTVAALWDWSGEGRLPVVIDASSCALGLSAEVAPALSDENRERHGSLEILDSISWAHDRLLPELEVTGRLGSVAVHPTCSAHHLGIVGKLEAVAAELAEDVTVPLRATCCGMAGDRGLLHPELTRSATAEEAAELEGQSHDAYLSSNRTCEIGLQQGTGRPYESFVIALERATR